MNTPSARERFLAVYEEELIHAVAKDPESYAWPATEAAGVAFKMLAAIDRGSFNKDGRALRATCRRLTIPYTYAAIRGFVAEGD